MVWTILLAGLTLLSLILALWQWGAGRRFPLHQRRAPAAEPPGVTLLKPLQGCDHTTTGCLRSWLRQDYPGPVQLLFGVSSERDPACTLVRRLLADHPQRDAELVVCATEHGANPKVSTLVEMEPRIRHQLVVVSDADVYAPPDLLSQLVTQLQTERLGLLSCFYALPNPANLAMRLEAVAVNADFWSQVLQARSLRQLNFALGAVMATTRRELAQAGGFAALANCLADDHELGRRIHRNGSRIGLSPVVVECRSRTLSWREVWAHQLRWARTIRACRPVSYFLSILGNATLWPALLLAVGQRGTFGSETAIQGLMSRLGPAETPGWPLVLFLVCLLVRLATAADAQHRLTLQKPSPASIAAVPIKDLCQVVLWAAAFIGRQVTWGGRLLELDRDGSLRTARPGGH